MFRRLACERDLVTVGVTALALLMGGGRLAAQDAAAPLKIGVFNAERIMAESEAGQQALAQFNQLRNQRMTELQAQQDQINTLRQQGLAAQPGSAQAAQLQRQLEDRMLQLNRLQEDVQSELTLRQNALTGGITQVVGEIIDALGEEQGYALVFNAVQSGLVYVDEAIDITDEIIQRLDAANPAGGS